MINIFSIADYIRSLKQRRRLIVNLIGGLQKLTFKPKAIIKSEDRVVRLTHVISALKPYRDRDVISINDQGAYKVTRDNRAIKTGKIELEQR